MYVNRVTLQCYCLHLTYNKYARKYFFIAFPLKIYYNKQVYPYDGGDFFMDYKRKL